MHTNQTKDRFIELRAQGHSLAKIASDLGVSKRTLVDWNQQYYQEIRQLRALELEAVYDKILASREKELTWMGAIEEKLAATLAKRTFDWESNSDLMRFFLQYHREINQMRSQVLAPLEQPVPAQNQPEPVGAIQNSQAQPAPAENQPEPGGAIQDSQAQPAPATPPVTAS